MYKNIRYRSLFIKYTRRQFEIYDNLINYISIGTSEIILSLNDIDIVMYHQITYVF